MTTKIHNNSPTIRPAIKALLAISLACIAPLTNAKEQLNVTETLKKIENPVSSLVTLPIEFEYLPNIGPSDEGSRYALRLYPIYPAKINEEWNVISRVIVPILSQHDRFPGSGDQLGLGDLTANIYLSPENPAMDNLFWGAGLTLSLPTATDPLLGSEKWSAGPALALMRQHEHWNYGIICRHLWDYAGDSSRARSDNSSVDPFMVYTTETAWSYTLRAPSYYFWDLEEWAIPIRFGVSKLTKIGDMPVVYSANITYWLDSNEAGPEGWGFRLGITFIFPK